MSEALLHVLTFTLSDMQAVGIDGECYIGTVVDDEGYTERLQGLLQLTGQGDKLCGGALLFAELHHGDTACSCFTYYPRHVTPS